MKNKKIPTYKIGRLYLLPLLMYFMLVLPLLFFMALKGFPELSKRTGFQQQLSDTIQSAQHNVPALTDSSAIASTPTGENEKGIYVGDNRDIHFSFEYEPIPSSRGDFSATLSNLFNILVLVTPLVGLAVNMPFKRYFRRKRKGKVVSPRLYRFCRKNILKTPLLNSGIAFIAFTIIHLIMAYTLIFSGGSMDAITQRMLTNFLLVSVVASMLTVLFIYFWQNHLVHIRYLEYIFTPSELQKRIFGRRTGKIRNQLYISSAMTTLFPLTIVLLYLLLSLTPVSDLKNPTPKEMRVMLGSIVDVMAPVTDDSDNTFSNLYYITAIDNTVMFVGIFSGILVSFVYILFFVNWSTQGIVKPVNELVRSMLRTGEGVTDQYTLVRTNDEVGIMSESYNLMSSRLSDYIKHISQLNEAYFRFVPRQFLEILDKADIVDIQLGDQVQKEMTVMFSDIRGFTELSESMTPKENFDFINHYLGYMEPVIGNNNGFIDKFIGDAIMALFHEKPDDALNAAIQMRKMLEQFNADRIAQHLAPIDSGIGMHTGKLMLGVVGGVSRMDGTVISDAVNLAARLEGLTKIYCTSIIISEDTIQKLENPSLFNFRFLDIARVKGKKDAVYLFEVLDGEPEGIRQLKIETKSLFGDGIDLYKNRNFEEAVRVFNNVIDINKHDTVAAFYVNRCKRNITKGIPDDWSGIEVFDSK